MHALLATALAVFLVVSAPVASLAATLTDELFIGAESLARGRFELAAQAFTRALAQDPDNAYAKSRLALTLAASGKTAEARAALEKDLAARDDDLFSLWTLGCLDLSAGDAARAKERFEAMGRADPGNARALLGQALAGLLAGDRTGAVELLAKVQDTASQEPLVRYLTGLAYWLLDAPANARMELEATLELDPRNTAALELVGLIYRRQGKTGLAQSAWEQALAIDPNEVGARFYLSRLAQDEGLAASLEDKPEEARRAYEKALSVDPTNQAAAKALGVPMPLTGQDLPVEAAAAPPAKGKETGKSAVKKAKTGGSKPAKPGKPKTASAPATPQPSSSPVTETPAPTTGQEKP